MTITYRSTLAAALFSAVMYGQAPVAPGDPQTETNLLPAAARNLARSSKASDDAKAQADKLIAEATALQSSGQPAEMRRKLGNAITLLNGQTWDPKAEAVWSLTMTLDNQVADS